MEKETLFSVSADIARRCGLEGERYRIADGRYVLTDKDLQRLRLTTQEFIGGIDATLLTDEQAGALIAQAGGQIGTTTGRPAVSPQEEETEHPAVSQQEEETERPAVSPQEEEAERPAVSPQENINETPTEE